MGLLGEGQMAKARRDNGHKIARLYHRFHYQASRSSLDFEPRGGFGEERDDALDWQRWLGDRLDEVKATGFAPYFNELVDLCDEFADLSSPGLERLLAAEIEWRRNPGAPRPLHAPPDMSALKAALKCLDIIGKADPIPRALRRVVTKRAAA
jgi:hypothetical protein